MTISNLIKVVVLQKDREYRGKRSLLVMSNLSFSHSVFKRFVLQTCKIKGMFGKGLTSRREKAFENNADKEKKNNLENRIFSFSPTISRQIHDLKSNALLMQHFLFLQILHPVLIC